MPNRTLLLDEVRAKVAAGPVKNHPQESNGGFKPAINAANRRRVAAAKARHHRRLGKRLFLDQR